MTFLSLHPQLPRLGGADAASPSAPGGVPSASAGVAEWKATFARLGLRPIDLALLGPDVIGDDPVNAEALLMQDPELLMLDEPIAGMSVRERELTAELLNRICKGRSMIVIEHDMNFVRQIADKVTVMHQGKILAEGAMEDVQADPRVIDVYLGH